jgi:hypothetical protein
VFFGATGEPGDDDGDDASTTGDCGRTIFHAALLRAALLLRPEPLVTNAFSYCLGWAADTHGIILRTTFAGAKMPAAGSVTSRDRDAPSTKTVIWS